MLHKYTFLTDLSHELNESGVLQLRERKSCSINEPPTYNSEIYGLDLLLASHFIKKYSWKEGGAAIDGNKISNRKSLGFRLMNIWRASLNVSLSVSAGFYRFRCEFLFWVELHSLLSFLSATSTSFKTFK